MAASVGAELLVWRNEPAIAAGTNPIALDTKHCCGLLKTQALLDGRAHYGFNAAFGGARRDEEKSRAKERVYSFRDKAGQWDPKNQRPELWNLYYSRIHPVSQFGCFRFRTGRRWMCGSTSTKKRFQLSIFTLRRSGRCICGAMRGCLRSRRSSRGRKSSRRWCARGYDRWGAAHARERFGQTQTRCRRLLESCLGSDRRRGRIERSTMTRKARWS